MADNIDDLLGAHVRKHNALIDSTVAQFDRGLRPILARAQASLIDELRGKLTVANGRIIRDRATQIALRSIARRFSQLMTEEGYDAHLARLSASFGRQVPMFEDVLELLGVPKPTWRALDKRYFADQARAGVLVLEDLVRGVGFSTYRSALLQIGGLAPRRLATLIADETGKTLGQASAIADTATTVFYRTIAARGYELIEKDSPKLAYRFYGPRDKLNRPFCRKVIDAGKTYTRAEIAKLRNANGTDPFTNGGGYRCRHQWIIAVPELEKPPVDFAERPHKEIRPYLEKLRDGWLETIETSDAAYQAVISYTGSAYRAMNGLLRGTSTGSDRARGLVSEMAKAFTWEIEEAINVYRGLMRTNLEVGDTFLDRGFMSTSLDPRKANDFSSNDEVFRIRLRPGQKAIPINGSSLSPQENELILPAGTQLRVVGNTKVRVDGREISVIDFEVEP
jgi:hypothetical protein